MKSGDPKSRVERAATLAASESFGTRSAKGLVAAVSSPPETIPGRYSVAATAAAIQASTTMWRKATTSQANARAIRPSAIAADLRSRLGRGETNRANTRRTTAGRS